MNARVRSRVEMGRRALQFSRAHADESAGYTAAVSRLEERLGRAETLANQQLNGIRATRAAATQRRIIRKAMMRGHLRHLARVARLAAVEIPGIAERISLPPRNSTYLEFRTTAVSIATEAAAHLEVLVRYGLVESVVTELNAALERFQVVTDAAMEARRAHVGASAELANVATEIVAVVRVLDGLNTIRFTSDAESLAAWRSASNILDFVRGSVVPPEAGGEVQPAA